MWSECCTSSSIFAQGGSPSSHRELKSSFTISCVSGLSWLHCNQHNQPSFSCYFCFCCCNYWVLEEFICAHISIHFWATWKTWFNKASLVNTAYHWPMKEHGSSMNWRVISVMRILSPTKKLFSWSQRWSKCCTSISIFGKGGSPCTNSELGSSVTISHVSH